MKYQIELRRERIAVHASEGDRPAGYLLDVIPPLPPTVMAAVLASISESSLIAECSECGNDHPDAPGSDPSMSDGIRASSFTVISAIKPLEDAGPELVPDSLLAESRAPSYYTFAEIGAVISGALIETYSLGNSLTGPMRSS
jgi:hypothetical protein